MATTTTSSDDDDDGASSSTSAAVPFGIATALSIDQWLPTKESQCEFKDDPSLSVDFLCMQPKQQNQQQDGRDDEEHIIVDDDDDSSLFPQPPPPPRAAAARRRANSFRASTTTTTTTKKKKSGEDSISCSTRKSLFRCATSFQATTTKEKQRGDEEEDDDDTPSQQRRRRRANCFHAFRRRRRSSTTSQATTAARKKSGDHQSNTTTTDTNNGCTNNKQQQQQQQPPHHHHLPNKVTAARYQEIFIDLVGLHCAGLEAASPRHILDDRFDSYLDEGERHFKDSLLQFLSNVQTTTNNKTHALRYLEQILRTEMGYKNAYSWSSNHRRRRNLIRHFSSPKVVEGVDDDDNKEEEERVVVDSQQPQQPAVVVDKNPGHVFVCNASVCEIQCDAFLCPAAISSKVKGKLTGSIHHQWLKKTLEPNYILSTHIQQYPYVFTNYDDDDTKYDRVVTLSDWPWKELRAAERNLTASPVPFVVFGEVSLEKSHEFAIAANIAGGKSTTSSRKGGDHQLLLPEQRLHILALLETVRQFLDVAMKELLLHTRRREQEHHHCFLVRRERYLLALPVLGTGGGFAGDLTGRIVDQLLLYLTKFVTQRDDVDVVLVCADEATYVHAQLMRHKKIMSTTTMNAATATCNNNNNSNLYFPCFQHLDLEQRDGALRLAKLASGRHLCLFLGAGVSIGSGLPGWFGLLHMIEDKFTPTGLEEERSLGVTTNWNPLSMADQLEEWCRTRADRDGVRHLSLKERVCRYLKENGSRPGLLLSLLISLPGGCHSNMVTQNYDQLIEKACRNWNVIHNNNQAKNNKKRLSVIPYHPVRESHDWLLKMHGCVSVPNEIILTSRDYANNDRSALAGLVQASLMTKHMLFVGFSLTDPNYLKTMDQVRSALRPSSSTTASK